MNDATPSHTIVHLDVDAFYVAVERELRPELQGRPLGVSQYNPYGDLRDIDAEDPSRILYDGSKNDTKKQSNPNANGSLIAVSYEARARNVRRNDRGHEAITTCPELCIVQVPVQNGKANLTIYRDASYRLMSALTDCMKKAALEIYQDLQIIEDGDNNYDSEKDNKQLGQIKVEKASIDEIYIDLTAPVQTIINACYKRISSMQRLHSLLIVDDSASTHTTIGGLETSEAAIATNSLRKDDIRKGSFLQVLDSSDAANAEDVARRAWWNRRFPQAWDREEISLAVGALLTLKARQGVLQKFNGVFTLSAGVSLNKVMAKLASGLKKPNRQTLINPNDETTLQKLFHPLPLGRIRGLGGRFGDEVERSLQVKTVGELAKVPLSTLQEKFGDKNATFLFRIARGICDEEVTERTKAKSIGAGKTFRGALSLSSTEHTKLKIWIGNLLTEIMERVDSDESRYPKTLVVGLSMQLPGSGDNKRHASQSAPLPRAASAKKRLEIAFGLVKDILTSSSKLYPRAGGNTASVMVVGMSASATNFVTVATGSSSILDAFQRCAPTADGGGKPHSPQTKASSKKTFGHYSWHRPAKKPRPGTLTSFLGLPGSNAKTKPEEHKKGCGLNPSVTGVEEVPGDIGIPAKDEHAQINNSTLAGVGAGCATELSKKTGDAEADFDYAGRLQAELNAEQILVAADSHVGMQGSPPNSGIFQDSSEQKRDPEDPDLEYALQLQASFDRENQVLSSLDQKFSRSRKPCSKQKSRVYDRRVSSAFSQKGEKAPNKMSTGSSIINFFSKK